MRGKKNSEKLNTVAAPVAEKAAPKTQKTPKASKKKAVVETKEKAPVAVPEAAPVPAPKKEAPKKEKKAEKKVKAEKPVKAKKEKKTIVKTEKAPKAEKKAKKEETPKQLIKAKLGKNEMEWVKEKIGFSCSNKACNEWSGRRFNYCPFCGRKAINSQFNHIGDKGERFE